MASTAKESFEQHSANDEKVHFFISLYEEFDQNYKEHVHQKNLNDIMLRWIGRIGMLSRTDRHRYLELWMERLHSIIRHRMHTTVQNFHHLLHTQTQVIGTVMGMLKNQAGDWHLLH